MTAAPHSTQVPDPGRSPAFQCYAKDLYTGTSDLSAAEFGAYWRGVCWSWDNGPLPNTPEPRRRALMLTPKEYRSIWPVIKRLWKKTPKGYINVRLEKVRKAQDEFHAQKRAAGLSSAAARAAAKAQREGNEPSTALPTDGQRNVNPSSASASSVDQDPSPLTPLRGAARRARRQKRALGPTYDAADWIAECRVRHGGACPNVHFHAAKMAEAKAS